MCLMSYAYYYITEHDLNIEIDRLVQASACYKRQIAELECRLLSCKVDADYPIEQVSNMI